MPDGEHQNATAPHLPSESIVPGHGSGASAAAIFVNYRRADSEMPAGRLADHLKARFGGNNVFMDVDGIEPGVDFVEVIAERLSGCQVLIAVIGRQWLSLRQGLLRRIFRPGDYARLELVAGLSRDILVVPALVEGATMPSAGSLPKSIADLTDRNAISLSTSQFARDADVLCDIIKRRLETRPPTPDRDAEHQRIATILRSDIGTVRKSLWGRRAVIGSLGALSTGLAGTLAMVSLDKPPVRNHPSFGQVEPDASKFAIAHPSEAGFYKEIDAEKLTPLKFPLPRGHQGEPILTLNQVLDIDPGKAPTNVNQTVFHAVGCTGNTIHPEPMALVAGAMTQEQRDGVDAEKPAFFFHLGDVIYGFGQMQYYFDQFYLPFRHYHAPILAIPGNHDGAVPKGITSPTLEGFLANFCADGFRPQLQAAGGLDRTPQIQPGVYYTFEAPSLRILALYSNVLEIAGVLANDEIGHEQLDYLDRALGRIRQERYGGALIIAHHHPAYTADSSKRTWSVDMRESIDALCKKHDVWPHAVLSAHVHNYQRLTRTVGAMQIPYVIAGCGGHNTPAPLMRVSDDSREANVPKAPFAVASDVMLESYDDRNFGYLRVKADRSRLTIEFRRALPAIEAQARAQGPSKSAGAQNPPAPALIGDAVTVDLASRKLVRA
jgi:hypothetical protein